MQALRTANHDGEATTRQVLTLLADSPLPDPRRELANLSLEAVEIARARKNPAAFAPLYERYVDAVYSYCLRRISDPEHAADMTSQIFARALGAMPRYAENGGTFRSWLFSIAHNLLIDTYRKHRDVASLDERQQMHLLEDSAAGPEHLAVQEELRLAFRSALAQITNGQRDVVELRLAGLTGPEIAEVLGMKLAAVKSTQFRAYTRLRELLAPYADPASLNNKEEQP